MVHTAATRAAVTEGVMGEFAPQGALPVQENDCTTLFCDELAIWAMMVEGI